MEMVIPLLTLVNTFLEEKYQRTRTTTTVKVCLSLEEADLLYYCH